MDLAPPPGIAVPTVVTVSTTLRDRVWIVRSSEDLQACVGDGTIREPVRMALAEALAAPGRGRWRTTIDIAGVVLSVAVDEEQAWILLGSPRFASEGVIVHALRSAGPLEPRSRKALAELEALVAGWRASRAENAPLVVQTLIARHHLTDLIGPKLSEARPEVPDTLQDRVVARAAAIAPDLRGYRPTWLERLSQTGLDWNARYAILRVHLLRFVAALPALDHDHQGTEVTRLLRETLRRMVADSQRARETGATGDRQPLPAFVEAIVRGKNWFLGLLPVAWVASGTRFAVRTLARIFIAGESMATAWPALQRLHDSQRDATLDQLGELVVSEAEADVYRDRVLELVRGLHERHRGEAQPLNSAGIAHAHVSVKVSALTSDYDPDDAAGTWQRVGPRLLTILHEACATGVFINLDAEHYSVRDLTFAMLQRALALPNLAKWPGIGLVVQAYLRDAPAHLDAVIAFCRRRGVRMPLRLVKGAYWDAETTEAAAHDFVPPQFLNKAETDAIFQMLVLRMLEAHDAVQVCVGSHNLRDHCFAHEAREWLHPEAPPVEHQCLHMTYEGLSTALARQGWAVRNYIPVGSLLVGMAYLVRRILENSSQVGVLTMARAGHDTDEALQAPGQALRLLQDGSADGQVVRDDLLFPDPPAELPVFRNVAPVRLYLPAHREAFDLALRERRLLRGDDGTGEVRMNPSDPSDVLGHVRMHSSADVDPAVQRARAAQPAWAALQVGVRAALLVRAAEQMRVQRHDIAAVVALEAGKARNEALADVDEAIDFLQFYAREAIRIETTRRVRPLGVVAVVAPWNFPLAIPCGMASAALVAGNAVILKPAEQTPLITAIFVQLLHDAGVPTDAIQHLPGDGLEVGAPLTAHPDVAGAVFTGSRPVGTAIWQTLTRRGKRAITEMGGKNAIIVTANADLDEAISGCLYAAFGHAGQKCSAASRILVDARILPQFTERFAAAAQDLRVGAAMSPGTRVNPVISREDQLRLQTAARACAEEAKRVDGQVLVDRSSDAAGPGFLVGPAVFQLPAAATLVPGSLARAELFGPIVHVVPFADLDEAVALFGSTEYALTGGIFAQSQDDIDWLIERLPCGNLYINRPITGARVAVEPFGGFRMSGTGPKAGGRDYLTAFYDHPPEEAPAPLDAETRAVLNVAATAAPGKPPTWRVDATDVASDVPPRARIEAGQQRAVRLGEAWAAADLLSTAGRDAAVALAHAARTVLPGLIDAADRNRTIPGQDSYNRWSLRRGPVLVLAGRRRPCPSTAAHVVGALATGNAVRVLCGSAGAWSAWVALAVAADAEGWLEAVMVDGAGLASALADPAVATVVLDGAAAGFAAVLPLVGQVPVGAEHLRAVVAACAVDDPAAFLRGHLHCRTLAVHTMRHGAPLAL